MHGKCMEMHGETRLARGEIIIETFKAVKRSRWQRFMDSLKLDQRVDFEEGDIGLAGGADEVKRPATPSIWPWKPLKN